LPKDSIYSVFRKIPDFLNLRNTKTDFSLRSKKHFYGREKKKKGKKCGAFFPFLSFIPSMPRHLERSGAK
jgi:hypothetical protein